MRKIILLCAVIAYATISSLAQHTLNQNKVWVFGISAGINFTSGTPVTFTSAIYTGEGCASIADATGNLLFYTDGVRVYNRTHSIMSGSPLVSYTTISSTQGALITPKIGSFNKYYVFSLEDVDGGTGFCRLSYSEVDMNLAGGMGDVVTGTRGTLLTNRLSEKMTAIAGNNCDLWVLVHRLDSTKFLAYNVSAAGISSPVVSTVGTFTGTGAHGSYGIGAMIASPNGRLIVTQSMSGTGGRGTELFDFNASTGVVSNVRVLDSVISQYGAEFSPDNTKLYTTGGFNLFQYNVTAGTAAAIRGTRTFITSGARIGPQLRLGPDNKIYVAGFTSSFYLDVINNPNAAGTSCGYSARAFLFDSGTGPHLGIPNIYVNVIARDTAYHRHDTSVCIPIFGNITIQSHYADTGYLWNDGVTTRARTITAPGQYWVLSSNGCSYNMDTISVSLATPSSTSYRHDTAICRLSSSINLNARSGWPFYRWNNGTTASSLNVTNNGNYWVQVYDSCLNSIIDTYHVVFVNPDTTINYSHDSAICITAGSMRLNLPSGIYSSYIWSTGSTDSSIVVTTSGNYIFYSYSGCNVYLDTIHVNFIPVPTVNLGVDTTICMGNVLVLSSPQPAGYGYHWSSGSHMDTIQVASSGRYWLRVFNGCSVTDSIYVRVEPYPEVDLGPDLINCLGRPFTLQSSHSYTMPTYSWNTGATTSSIVATNTGTYWESVSVAGCTSTDTIQVTIWFDTLNLKNRDTAICRGQFVQTFANMNPYATCRWLPTAGITNITLPNTIIRPDTSAMYSIHVYLPGCPEVVDSFFLDVQPNPSVYVGGNRFVCQFDTIRMHANVSPMWYSNYNYRWSPDTGLDLTTGHTAVFTSGFTTKYYVTVATPIGCWGSDSLLATVSLGNFATLSPGGDICPHDSIQMTATGGVSYRWLPSRYVDDSTSATPWIKAISNTLYKMIATSADGCRDTLTATINVYPAAVISLPEQVTLYKGESYHLQPLTNCVSFAWFPTSGLNNINVADPIVTPASSTEYFVEGTTSDGCKARENINISLEPRTLFTLPNVFTPGSSINNLFKLHRRGEGALKFFRVYNRWGNLVFETKNPDLGWDGVYNGEQQPLGVYVYEIEAVGADGAIWRKRGNVTLMR